MHLWLITRLTISKKVIDGLADRTLWGVATYGFFLLVNYCMNYLDNYPENWNMVFIWILKAFVHEKKKYN